ncbi:MAG: sulfatase-like hydrolase/transferase [Bryobacteraceae bacterium]
MKWWITAVAAVLLATAQDPPQPTSVILISIDTLRADHLSAYGYRKIPTPHIDSFARQGTVFTDVNSQIPLTLPSHTTLFTSTYPFENGIEENAEVVPAGAVTLASILRSHGYRTAAFVGSNMLDRRFGLDQGFEEYDSPFGASEGAQANPYSSRVRRDGALVLRAANSWLSAHRDQPVFLFVHLFDLHTPYKLMPARGSNEPETAGYDAEIAYVDQLLGRFQQSLIENGWWRKSLLVLLADHGESLGDHGELSHGYFIYQSTVHVPLIVHWPEGAPKYAERVTQPAGLIDVAPTILDALHLPAPPSFAGVSILKSDAPPVYSESVYARDSFHWAALRSLRMGRFKYVETPRAELFDLEKDPREITNILGSNQAQATTLRSELSRLMAKHVRAPAPARDTSDATKKALGSLGYLSGGPRKAPLREGPDPKDRLVEYQMFDRALDAMYSQRLDTAIREFHQVLALDRDNLPARGSLGDAYLRAGKTDDAVREWTAALRSDPEYVPAAQALGEHYSALHDWTKARPYLQQALAAVPGDTTIRFELGVVERNLGMFKEAVEHLKEACGANPSAACQSELRQAERAVP